MTSEDIEQQQKDALWAHRKAVIVAENARKRVSDAALMIKTIAETLASDPAKLLPGFEIAGKARLPATFPESATAFLNYDAIVELVRDWQAANKEVADLAATAQRLGISV